ncbi:hypothetical protein DYB35_013883 [Aphanomyces astaci]|uniref:Uncharacterized protein n=2 Tax=Aphanomyces astaci TaxID=112090 RepID=A0A418DUF1_APHAT|nr:hypothetical protein DYB35_013883 [Aphanomyces astaci]
MVHRRLLEDDHKGVNERLNETETLEFANNQTPTQGLTVRGSVTISVGPHDPAMATLRFEMHRRYLSPLVWLTEFNQSTAFPSKTTTSDWANRLPSNVGLTLLEVKCPRCLRLRLTHLFAIHEHSTWSAPATVDFGTVLNGHFTAFDVKEISLTHNRVLHDKVGTTVKLEAMQVRAFEVCDKSHRSHASVYEAQVSHLATVVDETAGF